MINIIQYAYITYLWSRRSFFIHDCSDPQALNQTIIITYDALKGNNYNLLYIQNNFQLVDEGLPRLDQCPYEPPDTCNQTPRRGCCERLRDGAPSLFSFMSATLIVMGVIAAAAF